jgi:hypothetical protein
MYIVRDDLTIPRRAEHRDRKSCPTECTESSRRCHHHQCNKNTSSQTLHPLHPPSIFPHLQDHHIINPLHLLQDRQILPIILRHHLRNAPHQLHRQIRPRIHLARPKLLVRPPIPDPVRRTEREQKCTFYAEHHDVPEDEHDVDGPRLIGEVDPRVENDVPGEQEEVDRAGAEDVEGGFVAGCR